MVEWVMGLPLWQMIRSFGVLSYVLLTIGIVLGIAHSMPTWNGKTKALLYKLHRYGTNGGVLLGLLHGVITVIDQYAPFSWKEVLIPFAAKQAPVLNGLGTLAGYGMLIVLLTTDLRGIISKKIWRMFHLLSYPIFVMAFIHGFFLGTDTDLPGIKLMYTVSILAVLSATVIRGMIGNPKKQAVTRRPAPSK